jgi:hypothetical protein
MALGLANRTIHRSSESGNHKSYRIVPGNVLLDCCFCGSQHLTVLEHGYASGDHRSQVMRYQFSEGLGMWCVPPLLSFVTVIPDSHPVSTIPDTGLGVFSGYIFISFGYLVTCLCKLYASILNSVIAPDHDGTRPPPRPHPAQRQHQIPNSILHHPPFHHHSLDRHILPGRNHQQLDSRRWLRSGHSCWICHQ